MRRIFYITLLYFLSLNSSADNNTQNYAQGDFNFNLEDMVPGDTFDTQESIYISNVSNKKKMRCTINNENASNGINLTASSGSSTFTITAYFPNKCSEGYNTLRITGTVPYNATTNSIYVESFEIDVKYNNSN